MEKERFEKLRRNILESLKTTLVEKNKRYGSAALYPISIFYKGEATNSIAIRLDDKLSRVRYSDILRKNDMFDLLGYSVLLCISEKYVEMNKEMDFDDFEAQVNAVVENLEKQIEYQAFCTTLFQKTSEVLFDLDNVIKLISDFDFNQENVMEFMKTLTLYFIEQEIESFEDLQD